MEDRPAALNAFLVTNLGINTFKDNDHGFIIYPNPCFGGLFNIDLRGFTGASVLRIFDESGKLLEQHFLADKAKILLDTGLHPGIYFLDLNNSGSDLVEKLLVN